MEITLLTFAVYVTALLICHLQEVFLHVLLCEPITEADLDVTFRFFIYFFLFGLFYVNFLFVVDLLR
jgi:hypothetical protein